MSEESKDIFILGGPNGAGKTTAARVLLPEFLHDYEFLNADEIARQISPGNPGAAALAAGRELIGRMRKLVKDGRSFAFETTCSGRSYVPMLKECRAMGWSISLFYFWLPSPEVAIARVAKRVREGGHTIPTETIRRRFKSGLRNMHYLFLPLADTVAIYDNGGRKRILVADKETGAPFRIVDPKRWSIMEALLR